MRKNVTSAEITAFQDNGFVVIDDFLNQDELKRWQQVVTEAVASREGASLPGGRWKRDEGRSDAEYYERVFTQRINLWMDNDDMRELICDERLGRLAGELAQASGIRIWHDQALIKPPWGNPTAWHLDTPYWSFSDRKALSIWIALDDATLQNGCLYFIPKSHHQAHFENVGIGSHIGGLFDVYTEWANVEPVAAPMKAGACSFHNGLCAHGAGANMTPHARRAMTCAYMPDGATFNGQQNILTDEQVAALNVGDPLCDNTQNPLIWTRTA